ncbi:beta strand repeat-containing protein [Sphingomonas sp. RT2P30]|uniref:beta strand repeat-containing protein n=1 Tax=Parasphingomonas halimpatiens TaxID=3096162 RepID=UPI002FC8CC65
MAILQSRSTHLTRPGSLENGTGLLSGTITVVAPDDFLTVGISNYTTNTNAGTTGAAHPDRASSSTMLRMSCAGPSSSPDVTMTHSGTATQGGTLSYTISVSGATTNDPPLTATFYLPDQMTYVAASGTNWTCSVVSNLGRCTTTAPFTAGNCPPITLAVAIGNYADSPLLPVVQLTYPGSSNGPHATDPTLLPLPTVSEIHLSSGPATGGKIVWIIGTNLGRTTAVMFGATRSGGSQVHTSTEIVASSPPGVGTVDVQVVTGAGTSVTSAADRYTYVTAPTVTSVSPASGPAAGGNNVIISGTGFTGATTVFFGSDTSRFFSVTSPTSIIAPAPASWRAGTVDVQVVAPGGTSAISTNDQYRYIAVPTVTAISPATGPVAGGTSVTITGTGFIGATAVTFGATPATGFTVNSPTQITATAPAGTGTVDVRVTAVDGTSATSAVDRFSYVSTPIVTTLSPASGPTTGGTSVTITGTGFTGATAVKFGATAATRFTVVSATQIVATAPAGSGTVDVQVTTPDGTGTTNVADQYTYAAAPKVTSLSPATGPARGSTSVTITGTGFSGSTAVTFGTTAARGFTVVSATQIMATAPAGTGAVDVTVAAPGGTSATAASDQFTYIAAPTIASISPNSGSAAGGTSVTISGIGFTGATAVKFGATSGTGITVVSATQITVTAPAGRVGTVDVTVAAPGGTSATSASDRFSYVAVPVLRTWVSGTGNDANACTRSAPCLTFAGAFANTLAGGEISCVDGADYGGLTITRAVAIVCDAAGAHVLVGNGDGIVVNAGASDAVTLSGLDISTNPGNPFVTPLSGIKLLSAGSLTIANTQLRGFAGSYAVEIVPTAPLVSVLLDRVSVARSPGSTGASMLVSPASGGTARVAILHSRFDASRAQGVHFDSVGKTGVTISALIQDSLFVSNDAGLVATARVGMGTISLTVLGTTFSRNTNAAIIIGAVTALFGNSTISTNGTGLVVQDGAVVRSAGDNRLGGNTVDGAFTSQAPRR